MDKEKQAFEEWCKQPDKTSKKDLDIGHMLAATAKEYQKSGRKIREILALAAASWHRGYKMGTETSNAEIARLKAEIERKDAALNGVIEQLSPFLTDDENDPAVYAVEIAEEALTNPEEDKP